MNGNVSEQSAVVEITATIIARVPGEAAIAHTIRTEATDEKLGPQSDTVDERLAKRIEEQGSVAPVSRGRPDRHDQLQLLWRCGAHT